MSYFSRAIKYWLKESFPQYYKQFVVRSEFDLYNKKEDESIWLADRGLKPETVEIYIKITEDRHEYVCDIGADTPHYAAVKRVTAGLGKIKEMLEKEVQAKG